jgi:hypothetical protein
MSTGDVEVLVIVPVADEALRRIAAVDPWARIVDARGWFDVELRETWPSWKEEVMFTFLFHVFLDVCLEDYLANGQMLIEQSEDVGTCRGRVRRRV